MRNVRPAADPLNLLRVMPAKGVTQRCVSRSCSRAVIPSRRIFVRYCRANAYVVAADSGVHLAAPLGLHVDLVVGDFDSADPVVVDRAVADGALLDRHPAAKDATDLELALETAYVWGAERIVVVGGGGGRLDHLLGNLMLLASPRWRATAIEAWISDAHVAVVRGDEPPTVIDARLGETADTDSRERNRARRDDHRPASTRCAAKTWRREQRAA